MSVDDVNVNASFDEHSRRHEIAVIHGPEYRLRPAFIRDIHLQTDAFAQHFYLFYKT